MEKTTVKKDPVSESGEKEDRSENPSGQGQDSSKDKENEIRNNLRAEYERKEKVLSEKLEATEERLAELEEKTRLSEAEKAEKAKLEVKVEGLEEEVFELEHNPKYRAYNEKIRRSGEKTKEAAVREAKYEISLDLLEDFVEAKAEAEKMEIPAIRKELNKIIKDDEKAYQGLLPHQRAKKAYKAWRDSNEFFKAKKELEEKKRKESEFSEKQGRDLPPPTYKDAQKKGDVIDMLKAVGQYRK
jgi:hypothetical protein